MGPFRSRFPRAALLLVCASFLLVTLCARAHAQSATQGALAGSVAAANGTAFSGAVLRLEQADSHTAITVQTGVDGRFSANALDPGRWTVTLVKPAQAGSSPIAVDIEVGRTAALPLLLSPRRFESVTVVAQSHEDDAAALEANITPEEISSLPVNARRWNN